MHKRAPWDLPRARVAHVLQLRAPIRPCVLGLGTGRGGDAHGLLVKGARRGVVVGVVVDSCSTVGDNDWHHHSYFLEGIHHILVKVWVVTGELISFVERLGQVPRRWRGIWAGMAEDPIAKRYRWVFSLGLRARGRSFRRKGWKLG